MYNLNTNIPTIQIYLDSRYGDIIDDKNTNVNFTFSDFLDVPDDVTVLLSVQDVEIPLTNYVINDTNNKLVIQFLDGIEEEIYITNGDYDGLELKTEIFNLSSFTHVDYNTKTNKLTFIHVQDFIINYEKSTCFNIIGFDYKDHTTTYENGVYYIRSDHMVDLSGLSTLYIHCPNISTSNISAREGGFTDVILKIPVNCNSGNVLTWTNTNNFKSKINEKVLNNFIIRITDEDNKVLDLNGLNIHWTMTLQLDFIKTLPKSEEVNIIKQNEKKKRKKKDKK